MNTSMKNMLATFNENYPVFWKNNGVKLLRRLYISGVPIYADKPASLPGVNLCQVRYQKKYGQGKMKTVWLNIRSLKEKQRVSNWCMWTLYPRCIKPKRKSIDAQDCVFCFWLDVRKEDYQKEVQQTYRAEIETSWDGTLLSQKIRDGNRDQTFPFRFTFPKRFIAKINRCLYANFFFELWGGPKYAAWHRTDEGIPSYVGTYRNSEENYESQRKICENQLISLLESPLGDAGVILLAYACFAVLKSFFPHYKSLDKNTPYNKAQKYIPEQLAVNVGSTPIDIAENLSNSFCGFFDRGEGVRLPVIDGVAVQGMSKKQTLLGVNEFESKVLQPACVLWVNRIPAKELVERGWILDLHLSPEADPIEIGTLGKNVVTILTDAIHKVSLASYKSMLLYNWNSSVPILCQMQADFLQVARKYNFAFDCDTKLEKMPRVMKEEKDSIPDDPVEYATILFWQMNSEVQHDLVKADWHVLRLLEMQEELENTFSRFRKQLRKCKAKGQIEKFSLQPGYEAAVKEISSVGAFQKQPKVIQIKAAYLLSSLNFFARTCLSRNYYSRIREKLKQALINSFSQNLSDAWASEALEKYIAENILKGRCARIRGKGSERAGVCIWYDPREKLFLLPSKTYYDTLKTSPSNQAGTKQIFERKLVDEGTLCTTQRGHQVRRTFEIKIAQGVPRVTVLKVRSKNFSEKFFADSKIQQKLSSLDSDDSSFRAGSTVL